MALDIWRNAKYRNPIELDKYVRDRMVADGGKYYIFIDEIQFVAEIQTALSIAAPEKKEQEITSLKRIPDSFQ